MGGRRTRAWLLVAAWAALAPAAARAESAAGPHEAVSQAYSATRPGTPSGATFAASYHGAGDPKAPPPYMRRMVFSSPPGMRYDTSVPARCTASDLELETRGPAACPPGSRIATGSSQVSFMGRFASTNAMQIFNGPGQQIIVAQSPVQWTVARGTIHPDGSIEFASPTCYPSAAGCPFDDALQLGASMTMPPYTRTVDGVRRSYMTTPPTCPASGFWETPIRWWWSDGTDETVVTRQPCD